MAKYSKWEEKCENYDDKTIATGVKWAEKP